MSYVPDQASWTHLPTHTPIQLNHTNFTHPPNSCDSGPQNFGDYNAPIQSFAPTSKPEASIPWPTMHQTAAWTPQSDSCKLSPDSQGRHSATSSATSDTGSPPISQRPSVGPEEFAAMSNQTLRAVKEESEVTGEMVEKVSPSVPTEVKSDVVVPMPTITAEQEEASSLLLSLSQPSALQTSPVLTDSALNTPFTKAQLASLRIEERIRNEALAPPASEPTLSASAAESIDTIVNTVATADFEVSYAPPISSVPDHSGSPPRTGRGFLRAPGLGPIEEGKSDETVYTCPVCSFCCRSKFHYNSHMNTHGDHRCSMCDYTSRTEGRLKKHMRESHTRDEQIAAGMDVPPEAPTLDFTTAMASVMEIAKSAVAAVTDGTPGEGTQPAFPSALDSIRQLTEGNPAQMALNMFAQVGGDDENDVTLGGKIDTPARRAGGKPKKYKCKNCEHISASKEESWRHNREHIPVEKQLSCQYCDFVTEYKHHLEYHCRNHMGSKPFKCTKCSYCCVNKSMLNSHMKSHSEHYMFQCIDCNYQSKYCHSLKMHLHKYNHRRKPGMTVDDAADAIENDPNIEDPGSIPTNYSDSPGANGTPAPMPTQTPHLVEMGAMPVTTLPTSTPATPVSGIANILLSPLSGSSATVQSYADIIRAQRQEQFNEIMLRAQAAQTYNCSMCDYSTTASDQMVQHNVIHLQANAAAAAVAAPPAQPSQPLSALFQYLTNLQQQQQQQQQQISAPQVMSQLPQQFSAHDMIMRAAQQQQQQQMVMPPAPVVQMPPPTQRVPSPLIKMEVDVHSPTSPSPDDTSGDRSSSSPGDHSEVNSVRSNGSRKRKAKSSVRLEEISARLQGKSSPEDAGLPLSQPTQFDPKQPTYSNHCHTCNMGFGDMALYTIHRGYHGFDNPLKCNRCGKVYTNSLDFNLHLMQAQHD